MLARERPIEIANPIYRELIVRLLGERAADWAMVDPGSSLLRDGRLDFLELLEELAGFRRQHGEILVEGEMYQEVPAWRDGSVPAGP
jgi:aryl carrier-like protein